MKPGRPIRLALAALLAVSTLGAQPAFEVASIKENTDTSGHSGHHTNPAYLRIQNQSLKECIMDAYGVQAFQISGGPDWFESLHFDIDARTSSPAGDDQLMLMLRTLLADRFHLAFHRESHAASGYALVLAKGGLRIKPNESPGSSSTHHSRNSFSAKNMSMERLAATVSDVLRTPVSDATGVPGVFDITLQWAPEELRARAGDGGRSPAVSDLPTLPEALQQQLGLKLDSRKVNMEVLLIDHAETPTAN